MAYANVIANQKQLKKTNKENICKVKTYTSAIFQERPHL